MYRQTIHQSKERVQLCMRVAKVYYYLSRQKKAIRSVLIRTTERNEYIVCVLHGRMHRQLTQ